MQLDATIGFQNLIIAIFDNEMEQVTVADVVPLARRATVGWVFIGPGLKRHSQSVLGSTSRLARITASPVRIGSV